VRRFGLAAAADEVAGMGDQAETLEREGVEKFADSFAALLDGIKDSTAELKAA